MRRRPIRRSPLRVGREPTGGVDHRLFVALFVLDSFSEPAVQIADELFARRIAALSRGAQFDRGPRLLDFSLSRRARSVARPRKSPSTKRRTVRSLTVPPPRRLRGEPQGAVLQHLRVRDAHPHLAGRLATEYA